MTTNEKEINKNYDDKYQNGEIIYEKDPDNFLGIKYQDFDRKKKENNKMWKKYRYHLGKDTFNNVI